MTDLTRRQILMASALAPAVVKAGAKMTIVGDCANFDLDRVRPVIKPPARTAGGIIVAQGDSVVSVVAEFSGRTQRAWLTLASRGSTGRI